MTKSAHISIELFRDRIPGLGEITGCHLLGMACCRECCLQSARSCVHDSWGSLAWRRRYTQQVPGLRGAAVGPGVSALGALPRENKIWIREGTMLTFVHSVEGTWESDLCICNISQSEF